MPYPPSYAQRVRAKVGSETKRFTTHKLLTGASVAIISLSLRLILWRFQRITTTWAELGTGLLIIVGSFVIVVFGSAIVNLFRAPGLLDQDRANEIATLTSNLKQAAKSSTTLDRDWPGDWRLMEDGFRRHASSSVRASWQGSAYGAIENWTIHGDQQRITREVRAFCKQSGKLLMVSPMSEQLSPEIRSQQDDENRWLYFLKETHGLTNVATGSENIDGKTYAVSAGEIYMLAAVSASACVECAAMSFGN